MSLSLDSLSEPLDHIFRGTFNNDQLNKTIVVELTRGQKKRSAAYKKLYSPASDFKHDAKTMVCKYLGDNVGSGIFGSMDLLKDRMLIGGGFVSALFYGKEWKSDIDIYVSAEDISRDGWLDVMCTSDSPGGGEYYGQVGIQTVISKHYNGKKVDIVVVKKGFLPLDIINMFDLDCCKVFIKENVLYAHNSLEIDNLCCNAHLFTEKEVRRLEKYSKRGFSFNVHLHKKALMESLDSISSEVQYSLCSVEGVYFTSPKVTNSHKSSSSSKSEIIGLDEEKESSFVSSFTKTKFTNLVLVKNGVEFHVDMGYLMRYSTMLHKMVESKMETSDNINLDSLSYTRPEDIENVLIYIYEPRVPCKNFESVDDFWGWVEFTEYFDFEDAKKKALRSFDNTFNDAVIVRLIDLVNSARWLGNTYYSKLLKSYVKAVRARKIHLSECISLPYHHPQIFEDFLKVTLFENIDTVNNTNSAKYTKGKH